MFGWLDPDTKNNMADQLTSESKDLFFKIADQFTKINTRTPINLTALRTEVEELTKRATALKMSLPYDLPQFLDKLATAIIDATSASSSSASSVSAKSVAVKCDQFNGEFFSDWLKTFENFLFLNNIPETLKCRYLLQYIGNEYARKLRRAVKNAEDVQYAELRAAAVLRFARIDTFAANVALMGRIQMQGESVQDFAVELQNIVESCGLSESEENTMLKNRFASGLRNDKIKIEVYSKKPTTFTEAVEIAASAELMLKGVAASSASSSSSAAAANSLSSGKKKKKNFKPFKPNQTATNNPPKSRKPSGEVSAEGKKKVTCFKCGKQGHYANKCWSKPNAQANSSQLGNEIGNLSINSVVSKIVSNFLVAGREIALEIDTGAPVNILKDQTFRELKLAGVKLEPFSTSVSSASGHSMEIMGKLSLELAKGNRKGVTEFLVSKAAKTDLLGVPGLDVMFQGWRHQFLNIVTTGETEFRDMLKKKFASVFDGDISQPIKGVEVVLNTREGARPVFHKAYNVPLRLRESVESGIRGMLSERILEPVAASDWASPMVCVKKPDGSYRLCIDPSKTVNPVLTNDFYPLPRIDELIAEIAGKKWYARLDLTKAYQQLVVHSDSRSLLVVNTIKGLFRYCRLPFGIKTAAGIFQREIEKILGKFSFLRIYIDDIVIFADSVEELKTRVELVLATLSNFNFKLNLVKSSFLREEIQILGHVVSAEGVKPSPDKVKAIVNARRPTDLTTLKSFLGAINYYSKFLPNLNIRLTPMFALLEKGKRFEWTSSMQEAFEICKQLMSEDILLSPFDPTKEVRVTVDACDDGLGGVLNIVVDGVERPIQFVSRKLTPTEKNYPILHREALAVIWAIEKFHSFLFGKEFKVFTDHEPLVSVFKKSDLSVVAKRLQRYVLRVQPYEFSIHYRPGKQNVMADFCSRFPDESEDTSEVREELQINCLEKTSEMKINLDLIKRETSKDEDLSTLKDSILKGSKLSREKLKAYSKFWDGLSVEQGVITYQGRVLIPTSIRNKMLELLHSRHLGMIRTKTLARNYTFWLGMNRDIETMIRHCSICQEASRADGVKQFLPWQPAVAPFERIHLDFLDYEGHKFFVMVDAFTQWIEIRLMKKTDLESLKKVLNEIFNTFGDPGTIVCDNGPPFSATGFEDYCRTREISLVHSPAYHPQSNGLAERAVRTFKEQMGKINRELGNVPILLRVERFLYDYRHSPTSSGDSPASRVFTFKPRTGLSKLFEKIRLDKTIQTNQEEPERTGQKSTKNPKHTPPTPKGKRFQVGSKVWYRTRDGVRTLCVVKQKRSQMTYLIKGEDRTRLAHQNQLMEYFPPIMNRPLATECNSEGRPNAERVQTPARSTPEPRARPRRRRKPTELYQAVDWRRK